MSTVDLGDRVVLVTGLQRSGTSLIMQALDSAGVRCLGSYPAFEDPRTAKYGILPASLMLDAQGGAVKVLEPFDRFPPNGFDYYVIMTERDKKEQAKSYLKFAKTCDVRFKVGDRKAVSRFRTLLYSQQKQMELMLNHLPYPIRRIAFEDMLAAPEDAFRPIACDMGLDVRKMVEPVRPRKSDCLSFMLETQLSGV